MNKNWHEQAASIASESLVDALQDRMMVATSRDKATDRIVAQAADAGMLDYENRELYGQWVTKMMY
ncbi:hypothetical protein FD30_GL000767 [Levilactobacillus namurensis DSM 19117]|uniref:Uncharacterized protein n=2 Tax=Levilactobacillus namurensis TaxID=380393 RepID=A0A0R1K1H6_9LACO|nr:hypothetical protein [Levilactobacillus namurensis]PTM24265.1 hypothetical protein DA798_01390 [Lactobacillus sp. PFC-70]KRK76988.1 hypothetical protein FD30_GL000767 [Levilactobacillus namurensis DSM 19117]MCW3777413.1 hypothetical protein [Levilactobacillus namurensis]MDT7014545.1 hypothetical protein [Levilactobacillus namurensis]MDT7018519.1 hypothetical protein [Levilactobacillus namurensis]